ELHRQMSGRTQAHTPRAGADALVAEAVRHQQGIPVLLKVVGEIVRGEARGEDVLHTAPSNRQVVVGVVRARSSAVGTRADLELDDRGERQESRYVERLGKNGAPLLVRSVLVS